MTELHYGTGDVFGYSSYDQVCLTKDKCIQDFNFLNVVWQNDNDELNASGLVGISPKKESKVGDLFIEELYKKKVLPNEIFSILIDFNKGSKITFGGYDMKYAKSGYDLFWHDAKEDTIYWELTLESFTLNYEGTSNTFDNSIQLGKNGKLIVDSGTNYIYCPVSSRKKLI